MADSGPEEEGRIAGALGIGVGACPYLYGSVLAAAWRQGYLSGQRMRELEEQEIEGHFRS